MKEEENRMRERKKDKEERKMRQKMGGVKRDYNEEEMEERTIGSRGR